VFDSKQNQKNTLLGIIYCKAKIASRYTSYLVKVSKLLMVWIREYERKRGLKNNPKVFALGS